MTQQRFLATPASPLKDAIATLVGVSPADLNYLERVQSTSQLNDEQIEKLEEWINKNINHSPLLFWATSGGVLQSADLLVKAAIENANIPET